MRKRKAPEHVNHERWLVSYADFITLLFAFFTTLYAISNVDQKKANKLMYSMMSALNVDVPGGGHGPLAAAPVPPPIAAVVPPHEAASPSKISVLAAQLSSLVDEPGLRGRVQVHQEKRGVVVSLAEAGFFESGAGELRKTAIPAIGVVAAKLGSQPNLEILVEGHTDDRPVRGRYRSNWELSTARATYVVELFQQLYGFSPTVLSAAGYAEYRPVAANDSAEGRARNRRVDLVVRFRSDGETPKSEGASNE